MYSPMSTHTIFGFDFYERSSVVTLLIAVNYWISPVHTHTTRDTCLYCYCYVCHPTVCRQHEFNIARSPKTSPETKKNKTILEPKGEDAGRIVFILPGVTTLCDEVPRWLPGDRRRGSRPGWESLADRSREASMIPNYESGLLACVCCACRIQYYGMALHCLLPLLHYDVVPLVLFPQSLYLARMNQHEHGLCWMRTSRKNS